MYLLLNLFCGQELEPGLFGESHQAAIKVSILMEMAFHPRFIGERSTSKFIWLLAGLGYAVD
jgi:hypothetical protein